MLGIPEKERIYCSKDGRRFAPPILTYLALPNAKLFYAFKTLAGFGV